MFSKAFTTIAVLGLGAAMTFATGTISGTFTYASGTTVASVTPSAWAKTVVLKVGATNESFTDVVVTGSTSSPIPSGTSFEILEKGSQPFNAAFALDNVLVGPTDLSGVLGRRTVPMSSTGVLTDSIGFPVGPLDINTLILYYPACTVGGGTYSFKNGLTAEFTSEVKGYSINIPTSSATATLGTVDFPLSQDPVESFSFVAAGNGTLTMQGGGRCEVGSIEQALYLTGVIVGTPDFFTSATLIVNGTSTF